MITRAERAELFATALPRAVRDFRAIGAGDAAVLLDVREVGLAAVAVLDSPARAALHHAAQFVHGYGQRTRGADTGGHVAEELVHEFAQPRLDLLACEPRRHQSHAAVDVVADAAGRDDSLIEIKCRDATDREAVTPMDIWHCERRGDDAGR
jgi:hypothetical protein